MKYRAIIFDFDGVIVDSEWLANTVLGEALTERGYPVTRDEALDRYSGLRWDDCYRRIEEESGLRFGRSNLGDPVDAAVAARAAEMLAVEGVESFVASQTDRMLAIASSSETWWLEQTLRRLGLSHAFGDRLYSAAGFARGKPHPDIYLHAADRLGVPPEACLVIEDHPVGVAAGAAAGMTVIALLAGRHIRHGHEERVRAAGASLIAHDYAQVFEIMEELERT
ncbi:MAG TPA: HAD family phosphatase [Allosphingosinicella sp.]|nr:HAD family phosphatase [Allosphingosinicella sp.]